MPDEALIRIIPTELRGIPSRTRVDDMLEIAGARGLGIGRASRLCPFLIAGGVRT
jgi:hypothetical protein